MAISRTTPDQARVMIEAERARQRDLGWSAEHDQGHTLPEWKEILAVHLAKALSRLNLSSYGRQQIVELAGIADAALEAALTYVQVWENSPERLALDPHCGPLMASDAPPTDDEARQARIRERLEAMRLYGLNEEEGRQ